jgi:hypothetical protein
MNGRLFVVTIVAASLLSSGPSGPSIFISHLSIAVAVVTQVANSGGVNAAALSQNSPISLHF